MENADHQFKVAFRTFGNQVAEATRLWFAARTINEVARKDAATLDALNYTPVFWRTVTVGLEYQAIIAAGKIFGQRRANPHNIDSLFQALYECRSLVFSAAALERRKRSESANAEEWLADFMKTVHVPTAEDFVALWKVAKAHRKVYEAQWANIRDQHVAHTELVDHEALSTLFQKTSVSGFEDLLVFLNHLYDVIWNVYYNGRPAVLESSRHSVGDLVSANLTDLRASKTYEEIVAETRRCLAVFVAGHAHAREE